jgi:hypothetical protein
LTDKFDCISAKRFVDYQQEKRLLREKRLISMKTTSDYQAQILAHLEKKFGDDLLAVVLFGSRARQTERAFSDFDVLLVINNAPRGHRQRRQLAVSIRQAIGLPIDATVLSPEAFVSSVKYIAPLMIELACAYEIWFEKDNFFSTHIQVIHLLMQQGKLVQLQPGVWKLMEDIDEMATDGVGISA